MATYMSSFTLVELGSVQVGPNYSVDSSPIMGGPESKAFYLEVGGKGVGLTETQMKQLFEGFLKVHDYFTEHGVSFEVPREHAHKTRESRDDCMRGMCDTDTVIQTASF